MVEMERRTKDMSANFDPTMGNFKNMSPFKMWCQKVLPLTYDDSLSYYEVLCKLKNFLNEVIENMDVLHDDVDALHLAYQQLEGYVNSYFDNLNVQTEINNKLDAMALDGSLSALIAPFVTALLPDEVASRISAVVESQLPAVVRVQLPPELSSQLPAEVAEQIPALVTAWLNLHITQPVEVIIDDSLEIQGAAADAKAVGDAISLLNNALTDVKDSIFNDSYKEQIEYDSIANSYVNSLGEISEASGYTRTDYIELSEYQGLLCDKDAMYCFWNETKTVFLGRVTITADTEEPIPNGAVYAILENLTTTFDGAKIYAIKESPIKEITDDIAELKGTADADHAILKVGTISGKNLYNKNASDNVESKSIYYLNGAVIDNNNTDASGYIEVFEELGKNVIVSGYTSGYAGGGVGMACFDENKTFVRGSNTNTMSIEGAKYIRLSIGKLDQNTFQCEYGVVATEYEEYTSKTDSIRLYLLEKEQTKEMSRWNGKKVLVLGDSISTDAYLGYASWATQWANNTGAILTNPSVHAVGYLCGVGSATPNENSLINLIDTLHETYPNNDDFDLIVFFRGTNDFGNSVSIGNSGDAKNASFTGAVEYCHKKAWEYWCKAQIVVFTPMQRRTEQAPNLVGKTLLPYAEIIKEKAVYMGFPVLDLYHASGFLPIKNPFGSFESGNSDFCTQYTMIADGNPDGLHPNELFTTTRLVPTITKFLEQI